MKKAVVFYSVVFLLIVGGELNIGGQERKDYPEWRSITGRYNNPLHPSAGETLSPLIRKAHSEYGDGNDLPRGVPVEDEGDGNIEIDEQTLPSARIISNLVHDQDRDLPSTRKLNQLFFQFGQLLIHDIGLTGPDSAAGGGLAGNENFYIEVPRDDPEFQFPEIPFLRSVSIPAGHSETGKREQLNRITAFLDGSCIYGSDEKRTDNLRTFYGGRLRTDFGPHGDLLPFNTFGEENANPTGLPEESLFLAGDVRANEQIGLTAIHTLFVREHNRIAAEIAERDFHGAYPGDPWVDLAIFQEARSRVGAILQNITYREWLPALIGRNRLREYEGYDPGIDPQISNVFSTAAFRIGHTMLPPFFELTEADGSVKIVPLRAAFFNPALVIESGIDPIFRGFALNLQQEIDCFIVDDVRNFLFPDGGGGFDLAALNIQRGRDHGLPGYNEVRRAFGFAPVSGFAGVSPDVATQIALGNAYGNSGIDALDVWTGGLCEPGVYGGALGETFDAIVIDQFTRLRDGDRFFFRNRDLYSDEFVRSIEETTFADVIRRNTELGDHEINDYAFLIPGFDSPGDPSGESSGDSSFSSSFSSSYDSNWRPDLRLGDHANPGRHLGDNIYNPNGAGQRHRMATRKRRAKVYLSLENDGALTDSISMRLTGISHRGKVRKTVHEISGSLGNVTSEMVTGHYLTRLVPGDMRRYCLRLKRHSRNDRRVMIQSGFGTKSMSDPESVDMIKSKVRFH